MTIDVAIVGAGVAGCALAIALKRRGVDVSIIDRLEGHATDYEAEKLEPDQWRTLDRIGLLADVLPVCHPISNVKVATRGKLIRQRRLVQYGFLYKDFIGQLQASLPDGIATDHRQVRGISHHGDTVQLEFDQGDAMRARLVVLATGEHDELQQRLGIERRTVAECHSMHFGFDVAAAGAGFEFDSLTYHGDEQRNGIDYVTFYRVPGGMRVDLYTYWQPEEPRAQQLLEAPRETLLGLLPQLVRQTGELEVVSRVQQRVIHLRTSEQPQRPGVVLVAGAYQSGCPATGTVLSRLLLDVDLLVNEFVEDWLATPGMTGAKMGEFYRHPRKVRADERSLSDALRRRRVAVDISGRRWWLQRYLRGLRRMRTAARALTRGRGRAHQRLSDRMLTAMAGETRVTPVADAGKSLELGPRVRFVPETFKRSVKRALWGLSPALFRRLVPYRGQKFAIGILQGESPLELDVRPNGNPVLTARHVTDLPAGFVADPFMTRRDGIWYMFFEVLNVIDRRGEIALATSASGLEWQYQGRVLSEDFHVAYPHLLESDGEMYMIPDTPMRGVRLYRATEFPHRWEFVRTLIDSTHVSDSTVWFHAGRWWMFNAWVQMFGAPVTLRLFSAERLEGAWTEHPASPLLHDHATARPGGRVLALDGRLIRIAQDGLPYYGSRVRAFEILRLDEQHYAEEEVSDQAILSAGAQAWCAGGMHHLDAHPHPDGGWFACVDGWRMVGRRATDA